LAVLGLHFLVAACATSFLEPPPATPQPAGGGHILDAAWKERVVAVTAVPAP
jgi:hypothetical protein